MNDYSVRVRVEGMARGDVPQPALEYPAAQCVCTWSWGLQPATALIDWVTTEPQPEFLPLSLLTIEVLHVPTGTVRHTFYGICKQVAPTVGSEGFSTAQEFVDSRELLQWDVMYCVFNKRESRLVDDGTGRLVWQRRYWHLFPADFDARNKTYTDGPLTARQIMDQLFASRTCQSPWSRIYHPALDQPVNDFDCYNGKKLGTCLVELSEALGCQFTLMGGRYQLVWCVRGAGLTPTAPGNSDQRRAGLALSGNPSRIRLLGESDHYQVLNMELEPDWLLAWQQFWNLNALASDLYDNECTEAPGFCVGAGVRYNAIPDDPNHLIGRYLAAARARTITVGAYADLRDGRDVHDGEGFRDCRKFGGRSRLQMPAALYVQSVLFRAFRPPRGFQLRNGYGNWMTLWGLELVDQALVEVTHDPVTGVMDWDRDEAGLPGPVISAGNGYAIVQGYQVGQDGYKTLRPEHLQINQWITGQDTWQRATFQTDDSGEGTKFILFDTPVVSTLDLVNQIIYNEEAGGIEELRYPVLMANPEFADIEKVNWSRDNGKAIPGVARVRAALIFAGEPYSYVAGTGSKDDVVNVPGLNANFVCDLEPVVAGSRKSALVELPYADGYTANQKAFGIACSLLNQQFTYDQGGYLVQGVAGTQLSEVIGRVTVRYGADGATEEVDFSNERDRNVTAEGGSVVMHVPPERDFDQRAQLVNLLPGQRELREEARQLKTIGASLRQNPKMQRTLMEAFAMAFGHDATPAATYVDPAQAARARKADDGKAWKVMAGTPLFKEAGASVVASPLGTSPPVKLADPVFVGVTVLHNERLDGPLHFTAHGDGGVVYARVKGPVKTNDPVGLPPDSVGVQTYLSGSPRLTVGQALESVSGGVALIPVRTNGTSGPSGGITQCKITSLYSRDYLSVTRWNNDDYVGPAFEIAKSVPGRMPGSGTVEGAGFGFTYADDNNRTSNDGKTKESQVMFQRFAVGSIIYVMGVDFSGVRGSAGVDLKYIEVNTAREWVKKYLVPTA